MIPPNITLMSVLTPVTRAQRGAQRMPFKCPHDTVETGDNSNFVFRNLQAGKYSDQEMEFNGTQWDALTRKA